MADLPPDSDAYPGTPRWVKVLGIILLVVILLLAVVLVFGGGDHGPGRHQPSVGSAVAALPGFSTVGLLAIEPGPGAPASAHAPPVGGHTR